MLYKPQQPSATTGSFQSYQWPPTHSNDPRATYQSRVSPQGVSGLAVAKPTPLTNQQLLHVSTSIQRGSAPAKSKDEWFEEASGQEELGAEHTPPVANSQTCGIDTRYLLPMSLSLSMTVGMVCIFTVQVPLISEIFDAGLVEVIFARIMCVLYAATFGCMTYCALSDPGQIAEPELDQRALALEEGRPLPKRAQKTWLYARPIRRYDHYCRWVTNCIGLYNHRPFFVMCVGIVMVAAVGAFVDAVLLFHVVEVKQADARLFSILLHAVYSVVLFCLAGPILKIHVGLVSRNELAAEWKRNDFYVARRSKSGLDVPVNDLSDTEFDTLFDEFVYDNSKKPYDEGFITNCWVFWCTPRWQKHQLGEF